MSNIYLRLMIHLAQVGCCIGSQLYKARDTRMLSLQCLKIRELNVRRSNMQLRMSDGKAVTRMPKRAVRIDARRPGSQLESREGDDLVGKIDFRVQAIERLLVCAAVEDLETSAAEQIPIGTAKVNVSADI